MIVADFPNQPIKLFAHRNSPMVGRLWSSPAPKPVLLNGA